MLVLESFPLGGGAFQPSQHSKIQSLIFLKGNSLKLNWDDVQFQVKWTPRGRRWYWRWMPKWWAHSKRESTLRRTRWMASVTSFTRVAMSSKRAGTNVNTRAGYSSETSKTWLAGEVARTEALAWWTCVFQVAPRASISPSPQDSEVHQAQLEAERFYHEVRESTGQLLAGRARWVLPPASIAKYWKTVQPVCNVQRCMTTGFILGVVFKRGGPLECNTQTLPPPYLPPKSDVSCTYEKESEKIVKHFHL